MNENSSEGGVLFGMMEKKKEKKKRRNRYTSKSNNNKKDIFNENYGMHVHYMVSILRNVLKNALTVNSVIQLQIFFSTQAETP